MVNNVFAVKHSLAFATALVFAALPLTARATCGSGQPVAYGDISAVMFERRGCGGVPAKLRRPKDLGCSLFWVFITKSDGGDDATYAQSDLPGQIGTFKLGLTLSDVRALLRKHEFFSLNPEDATATDIRQSVLTVKHCGVVTRIMMYPRFVHADKATATLFAAFDAIVTRAAKRRLSVRAKQFSATAIFDGP